ncbi:saccharopine dehydrogenase [Sediminibacterium roseum]|uniref:Saccharopine dehydrogenase n=1 Tax=Sediminibacterium roseum TaxID=1978412 RepID=A0ABW9ZSS5_9BACT|nr:saccharopine dehydrogenase C-terminal domain-containing protein [Sediminibacterium roseum]NCI50170.1 saccharopine dehydrogenase [Sediminibacterium roseum]
MKHILLFGAGKSATVLIDYLKNIATAKQWQVTIADANLAAVQAKVGNHPGVNAVGIDIEHETDRKALVEKADVVISLLPPSLHYFVALDCLAFGKHLLTASYVDEKIKALATDIKSKNILFLCEMGLDPGIDHMSAMQLVHRIKNEGGQIHSFLSHCGGLVAPESDTNPWHYKISWNPRNIVLAGKAGALFREGAKEITKPYKELFNNCSEVAVEGVGQLAYYPNRDSLGYIPVYALEEAGTFIRTTLRHPDFCKGWDLVVQAGLTDEEKHIDTDSLTISSFLQNAFADQKISLSTALLQEQFDFLGWNDLTFINKGYCSVADALQFVLEKKWALGDGDKDMIVMLHEIGYLLNGKNHVVKSELVVKGEDQLHTAMAKTVGLPLGIAAYLLLEGKITETGLHIPIEEGIYEPVLTALRGFGIRFNETNI